MGSVLEAAIGRSLCIALRPCACGCLCGPRILTLQCCGFEQAIVTRIYFTLVSVLCLAALTIYYWLGTTSLLGLSNDDVVFMALAKSLAAGLGYREFYVSGAPWHVLYPPMYPGALALLWLLFPDFWDFVWAAKALNVLLAALAVVLTWWLARRAYRLPAWQSNWSAVAVAFATFHATMIDLTMSDVMFAVCLLCSFAFLERAIELPRTWWVAGLIGGFMVFPAWCRSAGLALTVAAVFWLWGRCSVRFWFASSFAAAGLYAPWFAYVKLVPYLQPSTSWTYYAFVSQGYGSTASILSGVLHVLTHNVQAVLARYTHLMLAPLWDHHWFALRVESTGLIWIINAGAWGLVAFGVWRMARRETPLLAYFLPVYLALICVYPWDPSRYLLAISALLIIPFVHGVTWCWDTVFARVSTWGWQRLAVSLWLGFWLVGSLGGGIRVLSFLKKPAHHDALLADWQQAALRDGIAVAEWLKWNTPRDAVVMSSRPPLTYLQTGRQLANCSAALTQAERSYLREHDVYAVLSGGPEFQVHTYEFYQAHPDKFELKFRAPEGSLRVYRVSRDW